MSPIGSNVIAVKGQYFSVCSSKVLGPIFTKLGGKVEGLILAGGVHFSKGQGVEGLILAGGVHFSKGQGHRGQRSNFCISAVHCPICMKLGECIQGGPGYKLDGLII